MFAQMESAWRRQNFVMLAKQKKSVKMCGLSRWWLFDVALGWFSFSRVWTYCAFSA